ncbi:MAG: nitrite reductase small subunit NirD [Methylohalobius sp.]
MPSDLSWVRVCRIEDLEPEAGVCALVQGKQIAIFYFPKLGEAYAIGNYDPFSHANVLARGLTGNIGKEIVVASPMYKHHFSLKTGRCLENEDVAVPTYPVRLEDDWVWVGLKGAE